MFNLGFSELVVLAVIGLIVLGPEQLPVVARKLARILNELKRAADDAFTPVNEMKNQATQYIEKTREQMDQQSRQLQEGLAKINKQIVEENKPKAPVEPVDPNTNDAQLEMPMAEATEEEKPKKGDDV